MLRRAVGLCLVGAVVGLYGTVGTAQHSIEPALERQPVAEPRQDASAERGQDEAAQEESDTRPIESALKAIEAAIRELVAEEDAIESKRQKQREIADLQAQQDMARWAEFMVWATWAGVALTFVAVVLIARTLHHTKRAAIAAEDAVKEAKNATAAALKTVAVTRDLGVRQLRAYINLDGANITDFRAGNDPLITIRIKNYGVTPANQVKMLTQFNMNIPSKALHIRFDRHSEIAVASIGHDAVVSVPQHFGKIIREEVVTEISRAEGWIIAIGAYVTYQDIFTIRRRTVIKLVLDANTLRDGKGIFRHYHKGNRST
jgi:hypothetical protein